ncbi:site-specific recombinase XerD [Arthrobacter sp. GAS37]
MAYARDILAWSDFLEERQGKASVWEATRNDVLAYHALRRTVDPETAISAGTWNRAVVSLDRLYRWGLDNDIIDTLPFSYSYAVKFLEEKYVISVNRSKEKGAKKPTMRFFSPEQYVRFRNVGILGLNADGSIDRKYRGRTFERNAVMSELLVTTGLRIAEANALSVIEVSDLRPDASLKTIPFMLPAAITKGEKSRQIFVPQRVLKQIRSYCTIERSEAVHAAQNRGLYDSPKWIVFRQSNRRSGLREDGKRVQWVKLPPERRRLAILEDSDGRREPLSLWLSPLGTPVSESAWNKIFYKAAARCTSRGFPLEAYPHKLRHTFASNLKDMLRKTEYEGNILRLIQLLLGHASIETTGIYADESPETLNVTAEVTDDWSELLRELEQQAR